MISLTLVTLITRLRSCLSVCIYDYLYAYTMNGAVYVYFYAFHWRVVENDKEIDLANKLHQVIMAKKSLMQPCTTVHTAVYQ